MVVTCLPCTCDSAVWHERTALPSIWTVQAPHRPEPHPNLVPVSLRCSRTTQSSGVLGAASTLTALLLTVNATAGMALPPRLSSPMIDVDCYCPWPAALLALQALQPTGQIA